MEFHEKRWSRAAGSLRERGGGGGGRGRGTGKYLKIICSLRVRGADCARSHKNERKRKEEKSRKEKTGKRSSDANARVRACVRAFLRKANGNRGRSVLALSSCSPSFLSFSSRPFRLSETTAYLPDHEEATVSKRVST